MRRAPGTAVMAITIAIAGAVHAQSADSESIAEQLFNQARDLIKANRWADACPKLEASLRYDPALGTRLNLATCYENIDRLASAWTLYRESIDLATKAGDTKRRDYARSKLSALEPRLAKLTISPPAKPPAGLAITRDATPIDPAAQGVALYADAGVHEIIASAPGFEAFTTTITMVDGSSETVAIPQLVAKPELTPPTGPAPSSAESTIFRRSRTRTYAAAGIGAAGVVALGTGLVFGVKASSTYKDATAQCGEDLRCSPADYPRSQELVHDARSTATISTVLVIGGTAAIVASAVVYLTAPHIAERTTVRFAPVVGDTGAGLAITGGF